MEWWPLLQEGMLWPGEVKVTWRPLTYSELELTDEGGRVNNREVEGTFAELFFLTLRIRTRYPIIPS